MKEKITINHLFSKLGEIQNEKHYYTVMHLINSIIEQEQNEREALKKHPFWGQFNEFDYE